MQGLKDEIRRVCAEEYLVCGEGDEQGSHWMDKVRTIFEHKRIIITIYIQR